MNKTVILDKEELYKEFIVNNKSLSECAEIFNCTGAIIRRNLHDYGIKKDYSMVVKKRRQTLDELSDDEKQRRSEAQSIRSKKTRSDIQNDPVRLAEFTKKQSESHKLVWENKTEEELEDLSRRLSEIQSNRTPEQKAEKLEKEIATKKANHSFATSNPEKDYEKYLKSIYGEDDVVSQYTDDRYRSPVSGKKYWCDFYIKSKDLFIECNWFWMHGFRPYNPDDEWCQNQLSSWKEKAIIKKTYDHAIYVWTKLDVEKREVAKNNKLNFIEIY